MIEISREELAYAGGLFTGEGYITINRYRTSPWQPKVGISMTDLPPLERFQKAVGGRGVIYGPYDRLLGHKKVWMWTVQNFEQAQAVIAMLWPWLCPRRRARAAEVLDIILAWQYPEEERAA